MSFDDMTKYGMCVTSLNKVSEHVPACSEFRAERENNKIKLRKLQKIKLHITSFEFISFFGFLQLVFLFFLFAMSRTRHFSINLELCDC